MIKMLMIGLSWIGSPEVTGVGFLVAIGYLFFRGRRRAALWAFLLVAGNVLTPILKKVFARPRPDPALALVHETGYGFPSGHALAAVITAVALWMLLRNRVKQRIVLASMLVLFALLIGWSRLYLRVHWVSDVLFGYVVGLAWAVFVVVVMKRVGGRNPAV